MVAARYFIKCDYEDDFVKPGGGTGRTNLVEHEIDVQGHPPIKQPVRRLPLAKQKAADSEVDKMLQEGVIEPSISPWSSPIVLVVKKDNSIRFCVDFRLVNDVTRKDAYPLPRIDETLDTLGGARWYCTMDLASGYW